VSLSRAHVPAIVPASISEAFWSSFRRDVFTLIWMGYSKLDCSNLNMSEEEDITGELKQAIEKLFDEQDAPEWFNQYSVHEEPRIHRMDRKGKRRARLDIRFEHHQSRPRVHYEFEAKRLCKRKAEVGKYFGKDGLEMFLSGEYARQWPEAGMLGYVQSEDPIHWAGKLAEKLKIKLVEPWTREAIITELITYRTCHSRNEGLAPIRIFHALLSFI
jgi:hypothetical protein